MDSARGEFLSPREGSAVRERFEQCRDLWASWDQLGVVREEKDARKVCGLPPVYLTLRLLGDDARGEVVGYAQCPADPDGGSLVSVAGVLFW